MKFDWKSLIRTVAPTIGTMLGGPMAGMALQAVSNAVLGRPDGTEDEVEAAMQTATPDQLLAIKQAEGDIKIRLKELGVDLARLDYDDAKDARARQVAMKDHMPAVLAIMLVVVFANSLGVLFVWEIPAGNAATIYSMIGVLGTLTITACAYYHGSSRGSARKDEIMGVKR